MEETLIQINDNLKVIASNSGGVDWINIIISIGTIFASSYVSYKIAKKQMNHSFEVMREERLYESKSKMGKDMIELFANIQDSLGNIMDFYKKINENDSEEIVVFNKNQMDELNKNIIISLRKLKLFYDSMHSLKIIPNKFDGAKTIDVVELVENSYTDIFKYVLLSLPKKYLLKYTYYPAISNEEIRDMNYSKALEKYERLDEYIDGQLSKLHHIIYTRI